MSAERHLTSDEKQIKEWHKNVLSSWSELLHRLQDNEVGRGMVSEKSGHRTLIGYIAIR